MIVGVPFGEEFDIINMKKSELEEAFSDIFTDEILKKDELNQTQNEHLKLLAWLLYNNRIEIKWGVPVDHSGKTISISLDSGILHEKIGILGDTESFVTFSGSSNLTYNGWLRNVEEIKVFKSWDHSKEYALGDVEKFNRYWNDSEKFLKVFDFPIPFKNKITKQYYVKNLSDINFDEITKSYNQEFQKTLVYQLYEKISNESQWIYQEGLIKPQIEVHEPWSHQLDALKYLCLNNYKGFLSMATGSGKSRTAIFASYKLYKKLKQEKKKLITIIGVPDLYLVEQWNRKEVSNYSENIVICSSEETNWLNKLKESISSLKLNLIDHLFIIGTYKSLKPDVLNKEIFEKLNKKIKVLFIGDEAHSLGAPTGIELINNIKPHYYFGLSATPYRYFDDEGTKELLEFFLKENKEIHEFSLKDAQEINAVARFNYKIYTCYFDDNDLSDFISLSESIEKQFHYKKYDEKITDNLTLLLNKRADLIKKCKNKLPVLRNLIFELFNEIKKHTDLWKSVIYCKDNNQTEQVIITLHEINKELPINLYWNRINGDMPNKERVQVINSLAKEEINTILAMKCLDQGVDIPILEKAIFISSSGSDLEHIQRAGRILRKNVGKKEPVNIYDIIVIPSKKQIKKYPVISKKILNVEIKRVDFFSGYAENAEELKTQLFFLNSMFI